MGSRVKSAVIVSVNPDGSTARRAHEGLTPRRRRKGSKRYKGLEKLMRRMSRALATSSTTYLERHERSNGKKKDGWVKDLSKNMGKAQRRGMKVMKIRLF